MPKYLFFIFFITIFLNGQSLQKFEPPDGRVIHGVGQYAAFYYENSEVWGFIEGYQQTAENIPVIFSVYSFIDPFISSIDSADFLSIRTNHDYPYLLLVGFVLMDSTFMFTGDINVYVQEILDGDLDSQIIKIAQRIKKVGAPVFFRPCFEFGENNAGIHNDPDMTAEKFKEIWIYIYQIFATQNVTNVAWVWNTVNPNDFDYMEWYPGNEYVDWWGINLFTEGQINASQEFLSDAATHSKPVIVCESNPIHNGGTTNSENWENFFVPYFNKIKSNTNIKAFVYVNSSWENEPLLDWPDSRITSNSTISNNYRLELQDSIYIHMDEYLANPDLITSLDKNEDEIISDSFDIKVNNYPNPFNSNTIITWRGKSSQAVEILIYNVLGKKIRSFNVNNVKPGMNEITWDAKDFTSGIYYAKIISSSVNTRQIGFAKMVLLK